MTLPAHASHWMDLADIDYIGPFVKAWAAFNAWYRHASGQSQERAMLEFVKGQPNTVRRNILGLLYDQNQTTDALKLKQSICDLQQRLDGIQFEVLRRGVIERISLQSVCIRPRNLQDERWERRRHEYRAMKIAGGETRITVTSLTSGVVRFEYAQPNYAPEEVYSLRIFADSLSEAQRGYLRQFYDSCNPRPMCDLVHGSEAPLQIGAMQFRCTTVDLFAGLIETVYAMRNALFHGDVDPDAGVLDCYEAAYRVVMHFLWCAR